MSVSFEGVGQVCATFWGSGVTEGHVVKMTGNGTVGACAAQTGDGAGGVTCPEKGGRACLVADVDSAAKTATILL